jgi:cobalt-zinc-cadmium efflux system outer membrane protein
MVEFNIPLQQSSRRAMERESESMLPPPARARSHGQPGASELAENLSGIEAARRTETLATTSLLPQAELTFKLGAGRLRERQGRFRHAARSAAADSQGAQNQIKAQAEAQIRLAEIERLLGEDL